MQTGQSYSTAAGILGDAWDSDADNGFRPAGLFRLSTSTYNVSTLLLDNGNTFGSGTATHSLTLYRYASGALVFGAGTMHWSWGLDVTHDQAGTPADANLQQATVNLLADMGAQPATLQSGLLLATKSTDTTPPSSFITSPANGNSVATGIITITGTAADSGGGVIGGVEVSVDGGVTWHPAIGRESWSYLFQPTELGNIQVLSRAVDDSGNLENPTAGITFNVTSSSGSGSSNLKGGLTQSGVTPLAQAQAAVTQSYDLWIDFESDTTGSTVTAAQLAQSSHGATGTWSAGSSLVTAQTASQDPGDPGTRGLRYSSTSGAKGFITYNLPTSKSTLSIGLWYKTGASYSFAEGPH
ncbi:MAG: N,N-dimethylformamidase beta subunit family domain-containing protein, partial [Bryobacteraceae bacterium]